MSHTSLAHDIYCDSKDTIKKTLNFFSSAAGETYEDVLPMYAFYALSTNDDAVIELVIKNSNHLVSKKHEVLSWLSNFVKYRSGKICVRNYYLDYTKQNAVPNVWRFLEVPHLVTKYTYMADVYIFLM